MQKYKILRKSTKIITLINQFIIKSAFKINDDITFEQKTLLVL